MSGDCAPRIATRVLEWFAYGFYLLLYFTIRIFTCMVCASSDKEVLCISVHPLHLLVFFFTSGNFFLLLPLIYGK